VRLFCYMYSMHRAVYHVIHQPFYYMSEDYQESSQSTYNGMADADGKNMEFSRVTSHDRGRNRQDLFLLIKLRQYNDCNNYSYFYN
jgi:hypothetical protein